jgi:hypothetical protein
MGRSSPMRIATGRVRTGFGIVAAAGLAAVALDVGVLLSPAAHGAANPAADRCPAIHARNPYAVAQRFILGGVERHDLRGAYALATPALRHGASCREWARGHVSLPKMANIDWKRSGYKPVAGGSDQLVLRIFLAQPNAALPASFLMELRQEHDGGWKVGFFERDQAAPQDAALAA